MKRFVVFILAVISLFFLCGCSLWYEYVNLAVDSFDLGYNQKLNKAFFARYNWDGTDESMDIILPEYYNGTSIIGLGGYTGRGYPAPFMIRPTDAAKENLCPTAIQWSYVNHTARIENYSIQYMPFQLYISKNIKEIENLSMGGIILAEYEENGETRYSIYVLTCYVTCDENNKNFYSKEGKLYLKENDTLVENIIYDDFDIDKFNEQNKDQPSVRSVF